MQIKSKEKDTSFGLLKRNGIILTELGLKKKLGKILGRGIFFREMGFKDKMYWVREQNRTKGVCSLVHPQILHKELLCIHQMHSE